MKQTREEKVKLAQEEAMKFINKLMDEFLSKPMDGEVLKWEFERYNADWIGYCQRVRTWGLIKPEFGTFKKLANKYLLINQIVTDDKRMKSEWLTNANEGELKALMGDAGKRDVIVKSYEQRGDFEMIQKLTRELVLMDWWKTLKVKKQVARIKVLMEKWELTKESSLTP